MYQTDLAKLNGKMAERGMTKEALAEFIGVDRSTLYRRLNTNKLLVSDAHKIAECLHLSGNEAIEIFLPEQSHKCD